MLALTFAPCALTCAPCILTFASCTCGGSLLWTGADTRADSPLTRGSITLCNLRWWCLHPPTRANTVLCTQATCTVWWSVVVVVVCGGQLYTSQVLVPLVSLYHQHTTNFSSSAKITVSSACNNAEISCFLHFTSTSAYYLLVLINTNELMHNAHVYGHKIIELRTQQSLL